MNLSWFHNNIDPPAEDPWCMWIPNPVLWKHTCISVATSKIRYLITRDPSNGSQNQQNGLLRNHWWSNAEYGCEKNHTIYRLWMLMVTSIRYRIVKIPTQEQMSGILTCIYDQSIRHVSFKIAEHRNATHTCSCLFCEACKNWCECYVQSSPHTNSLTTTAVIPMRNKRACEHCTLHETDWSLPWDSCSAVELLVKEIGYRNMQIRLNLIALPSHYSQWLEFSKQANTSCLETLSKYIIDIYK